MHLKLVSLLGIAVVIFLAWLLSLNRKCFPWRALASGLTLQFAFGLFILKNSMGLQVFTMAQKAIEKLNVFAGEGAAMVFGPLSSTGLLAEKFGPGNAFILAITISTTIILI